MTIIKSYLGKYSDLFKKTQSELLQIEVREADDLSQLSQFFDRIRKELDSKEELLKAKYKSMVNSYEISLSMDLEFLETKCRHLCEVIDSNSQKLKTFTKMKPNSSEEIMNSYNLESILLKEKAGTYKLSHKDFTVQAETSFQFPTVECNFRKVRDLINEINVISHSNPECSNSSRETLGSAKKLENTSKGPDTDCKTHYSVRLDVEHMDKNESLEISAENKRKYIRH
ncbi:unnamed protein product [Moneuplotes crassus]|uniref:Uncharacterized protein n=1 Tax=Euplotes crassus TaxID=5936 RepID=A0AAD1U712_EUPCR|nr:unnamed protein product [Moneuplotes crassus]